MFVLGGGYWKVNYLIIKKSIGRSLDVLFPCNLENYIDERKRQYDIERKVKI